MAGKKQTPAPIDRPISRAYLREFAGWSTAYPPGVSEPTSLRLMENVLINRDGSARIRPALRYLSYETTAGTPGPLPSDYELVGTLESFYLNDGSKAFLVATRRPSLSDIVTFGVLKYDSTDTASPYELMTLTEAGFTLPAVPNDISFTSATTYVTYVQIDNKILALSNAGEDALLFYVGADKSAVNLQELPGPELGTDTYDTPAPFIPTDTWIGGGQSDFIGAAFETPTANTVISSNDTDNKYALLIFYTYANVLGESMASGYRVTKMQRPWSGWKWESPNSAGEPSGTEVNDPSLCADQLMFLVAGPTMYNDNIDAGATHLNVYVATWNDQDPFPVEAVQVVSKSLIDESTGDPLDYDHGGWATITPAVPLLTETAPIPNKLNRRNYSTPPTAGQGLVASDRLVLVNDPNNAAVIKWTSNQQGNYLNFTATKGGGFKTLTSGNMQVPACVKLWQNPQSVDTLTILCAGVDGHSTGYYMAPAQVAQQADATNVMGFEETTATPGTTSPYGCLVALNALYHPLDNQLMKSTASNYNINHKSQTDTITDQWSALVNKHRIVSAQHDNRLYFVVHNANGEALESGCMGNEIWVLDLQAKTPQWSRWLIQAASLHTVEVLGRIYMAVIRPEGVYYLDENSATDQYVSGGAVAERAIPWLLETNTQGANRAHDAWCRLIQLSIQVGFFQGQFKYGVRGLDRNGQAVDKNKIIRDNDAPGTEAWDFEDYLQVQRDMREWFFYAESVETGGVVQASSGQISLVQYRYTPVSVNVGYAYGSVETFEYGVAGNAEADRTTVNGIPMPYIDTGRP